MAHASTMTNRFRSMLARRLRAIAVTAAIVPLAPAAIVVAQPSVALTPALDVEPILRDAVTGLVVGVIAVASILVGVTAFGVAGRATSLPNWPGSWIPAGQTGPTLGAFVAIGLPIVLGPSRTFSTLRRRWK